MFLADKELKKGLSVAVSHQQWIVKFVALSKKEDANDFDINDVTEFKSWLLNRYPTDYIIESALHSVRCFLRFHRRYDILFVMTQLGRKPNLERISEVKDYRQKGFSFRNIQNLMLKKNKRNYDLKTLHFWAHH